MFKRLDRSKVPLDAILKQPFVWHGWSVADVQRQATHLDLLVLDDVGQLRQSWQGFDIFVGNAPIRAVLPTLALPTSEVIDGLHIVCQQWMWHTLCFGRFAPTIEEIVQQMPLSLRDRKLFILVEQTSKQSVQINGKWHDISRVTFFQRIPWSDRVHRSIAVRKYPRFAQQVFAVMCAVGRMLDLPLELWLLVISFAAPF